MVKVNKQSASIKKSEKGIEMSIQTKEERVPLFEDDPEKLFTSLYMASMDTDLDVFWGIWQLMKTIIERRTEQIYPNIDEILIIYISGKDDSLKIKETFLSAISSLFRMYFFIMNTMKKDSSKVIKDISDVLDKVDSEIKEYMQILSFKEKYDGEITEQILAHLYDIYTTKEEGYSEIITGDFVESLLTLSKEKGDKKDV